MNKSNMKTDQVATGGWVAQGIGNGCGFWA